MNTSKLCIDATSLDMDASKRGIGLYVRTLSKGLEKNTQFWDGVCTLRYGRDGEGPSGERITLPFGKLPERVLWLASAGLLKRKLENEHIGIFHSTHPYHTPISRKFKTIATIYDLIPLIYYDNYLKPKGLNAKLSYKYYLHQLKRADHLIAISDQTKSDVVKYLGINPNHITSIHLGIDTDQFRPILDHGALSRLQIRLELPPRFFLYVGGGDFRKNLKKLIEGYSCIAGQVEDDLVVVGSWYPTWLESLRDQLREMAIESRVKFLSFVPSEDLPGVYNLATALVFPSLYEGFGLPVLEAFSSGTPVLCSDTSSLNEIAGGCALLVDPLSVQEIADGMKRLASNGSLRVHLREAGLKRARDFSIESMCKKTLGVYRAISL